MEPFYNFANVTNLSFYLFRYFTQLYLALVLLPSPECVATSETLCQDIYHNMTEFFKAQPYEEVLKWEQDHDFFWSTLLPLISALYIPNTPTAAASGMATSDLDGPDSRVTEPGLIERLQLLSIETILFGLQVMLSRENQRKILAKEGLVDYVRCLPAHVPKSLLPQAKRVVDIVSPNADKQTPPSLLVTTKAHLAKMYFGLNKILELSVGQLMSKLLV